MSKQIKEGSTNVSVRIRIIDASDGTPETGVTSATSGLDIWYQKEGALPVDITESDLTALTDAHSDGGMKHINDGYYRLDVPDAAFTGVDSVMIGGTVTGMIVIGTELQIVEYDPNDAVRLGLTALPNAAADAAGGLPISDAGGLDLDTQLANAVPTVDAISDGVWDEAFSGHTSAGTFGKLVTNLGEGVVAADGSINDVSATTTSFITDLTEATSSHYSDLTLIFTDGALKGQAKPISSYNGTTKAITLDEALTEAPTNGDSFLILAVHIHPVSQIATSVRTEMDSNSTQLAAIVADTNELQSEWVNGGRLDLLVDAIKAVTDALPDSGALTSLATAANLATVDTVVNGIQTDLDNATDGLGALKTLIDNVQTKANAIEVDTQDLQNQIGTAGAGLTDLGGMSTGMKAEVNAEADTALTDYDPPTNAEMEARTPTAAQLAYITANAATGLPVTFTTSGGSTTNAVLNQVDGASASTTDDQYNGRLLVFTDGTLKGVVTDITDYTGSNGYATITAIPLAPTASHNARLI